MNPRTKLLSPIIILAVSACTGATPATNPASSGSAGITATPSTASASTIEPAPPTATQAPSPTPTASVAASLPAVSPGPSASYPTSPATGLEMVLLHAGAETHAVAAGSIYLGSGLGLDQLDPNSRRATLVDDDPGVYLSAVDDVLWRAAWATSTVYRYDAVTNDRDLELTVSLPGGIYATSSTVFVSEHEAGGVVMLDANSGEQIGRTQLVPAADCCSVAGIESDGDSLWISVGWYKKVFRLDQTDGSVLADIDLEHHPSPVFRYANGFVWIRAATDYPEDVPEPGLIYRIDPQTNEVIPLLVDEDALLASEIDGELWFAAGSELINVDPDTGQTIRAIELNVEGFDATEMFEAFGYVWVTAFEDPRALRLSRDEFH